MSASLQIVTRRSLGPERWNTFADGCDEAWLWHRAELQDALCTWPGRRDASFAVIDSGERLIALVPLHCVRERLARIIPMPCFESFGGPAFANDLAARSRAQATVRVQEELLRIAAAAGASEITVSLSPMAPAFRGERLPRVNPLLADLGCENVLSQTWLIDLAPGVDELWSGLEGRARTAVRKAEREGLRIRLARADEADLAAYYDLHRETYGRSGIRPHPRAYFELIWRDFLPAETAVVLFAEAGERIVAAANFGCYKEAAWYWTGASSEEGLAAEAGSLLQWSAIRRFAERGLRWFESGEAFPGGSGKARGLSDFKKSFGGELYPFYRGRIRTAKPLARIRRAVRALRNHE